ncbi:hypothetical protein OG311_03855 [Streptomyces sp. NBC_01343]|uniref:hypothetical protein n=1 Tax=Streptomyces sp. NBC_01343 TaxID=2903832 RepID=UPI002E1056DE|nr:hypothetical protein OG311_03855 [Streptomyces sp. NBC_01343]
MVTGPVAAAQKSRAFRLSRSRDGPDTQRIPPDSRKPGGSPTRHPERPRATARRRSGATLCPAVPGLGEAAAIAAEQAEIVGELQFLLVTGEEAEAPRSRGASRPRTKASARP